MVWKPGGGRREDVNISYLIFRVERASEVDSFDLGKILDVIDIEL